MTSVWQLDPRAFPERCGIRFGDRGTHTSRTIMLSELADLLAAVPAGASSDAYDRAIVDDNVLGKATMATRRMTRQRLRELFVLDARLPLFRVLRRTWGADEAGRPLIAMLCALARDPLLRATASAILGLPAGAELVRTRFLEAIRDEVGPRLNDAVLDKVARNAGSSWCQSGHLSGRVRKVRQRVLPTPGAVAFALWLGTLEGASGESLLYSRWAAVLDARGSELLPLALKAKQLGLIHARSADGLVEIDPSSLDVMREAS